MKPVQPEELSALLDGELSAGRKREVEASIAADPALRPEFQLLQESDARWRAAAATAAFLPAVHMRQEPDRPHQLLGAFVLVVLLVAVRMATKLTDSLVLGFGAQAVALAVLLAAVTWLAAPLTSARSSRS